MGRVDLTPIESGFLARLGTNTESLDQVDNLRFGERDGLAELPPGRPTVTAEGALGVLFTLVWVWRPAWLLCQK